MSPLLFALYISDIGREMTASSSGAEIGGLRVCANFFADDIALIARTSLELKGLIKKVKNICWYCFGMNPGLTCVSLVSATTM